MATSLTRYGIRLIRTASVMMAALTSMTVSINDVMAVPAYPYAIKATQPDGTEITIFKRGDERMSWEFSEDGILLTRGKDNAYVYATTGVDGLIAPSTVIARDSHMRTEADREFISRIDTQALETAMENTQARIPARIPFSVEQPMSRAAGAGLMSTVSPFPATGEQKILVVLVEYQDKKFKHENPRQHYEDMLNKEGYTGDGAAGSARDWFVHNSKGAFRPQFDIYGPITLPNDRSYYGKDGLGHDTNAWRMALHACDMLDDSVDFSQYDANHDGYIDNIYIFYAGRGQADSPETDAVWPHSFDVVVASGKTYKYDGVTLNHYATSNEVRGDNENYTGIGTFIHEFSHVMGLPDLYTTNYNNCFTPGPWSILDYGPYNNNGITPPNYSAYERYCLGWLKPERLLYDGHYELPNMQDTNKAYLVPTDQEDIIFILENRQQKGFDEYIPGHGMLIWNIEFNQSVWNNNGVNNIANRQYVDIIEADNKKEDANRDADCFPGAANVTSIGPSTRPAFQTQTKQKVYYSFSNIAEKNGVISFDVTTPYDREGVDDIITDKKITVEGNIISSGYSKSCEVFDISGRSAGVISPFGEIDLGPGIFIIMTPDGAIKVAL